jgi:ATPase subunit of ABC transporter with duplicated ATPase domains
VDGVLELNGLTRRYGDLVALDDLSFTVAEGQMFGFVGPNGAGKTTAMRIVLGVLEPDRGEVRWRGRPVDAETRRRFGYMPEDYGQTFSQRFAADRSSWPIADDMRTSGSGRPAHRAAGLWSTMAAPAAWLTELGFAGQAAAFKCDV